MTVTKNRPATSNAKTTAAFGEGSQGFLAAKLAMKYMQNYRQRLVEYEEECRQDRAEGHRPHYCLHGMNLWVDWDPICGPCEDALGILGAYAEAVVEGKRLAAILFDGIEHIKALNAILPYMDPEPLYKQLWAEVEI